MGERYLDSYPPVLIALSSLAGVILWPLLVLAFDSLWNAVLAVASYAFWIRHIYHVYGRRISGQVPDR